MRLSSIRAFAADVATPIRNECPVMCLSAWLVRFIISLNIVKKLHLLRALPFSVINRGVCTFGSKMMFLADK